MKILVAEDSSASRLVLSHVLKSAGHELMAAEDGARALEAFQRWQPAVVITDWQMPELDGLQLVQRIRAHVLNDLQVVGDRLVAGMQSKGMKGGDRLQLKLLARLAAALGDGRLWALAESNERHLRADVLRAELDRVLGALHTTATSSTPTSGAPGGPAPH